MLSLAGILFLVFTASCADRTAPDDNSIAGTEYSPEEITNSNVVVLIATSLGDIQIRIDTVRAPITAVNFLRYVDHELFDAGSFFRTVHPGNQPGDSLRIEVIQGGADRGRREEFYDPIVLERTSLTGLSHEDGCISMARGEPDSATSSFFICIGDQPELDYGGMRNPDGQGFAAFGRVESGMRIVREIQMRPATGQSLTEPVLIRTIRRH